MFQALFLKHAISFACVLLWAAAEGMANPTGDVVNHAGRNETVASERRGKCPKYNRVMAQPANATQDRCLLHAGTQTWDHEGNSNYSFTFNGNAVEVHLHGFSVNHDDDDRTTNASVSYLLDDEKHTLQVLLYAEAEASDSCRELVFIVQDPQNGEHTLVLMKKSLSQLNISIDSLDYKEVSCSSTNNKVLSTGATMSSNTDVDETSATSEVEANTGNIASFSRSPSFTSSRSNMAPIGTAPRSTVGPRIGGIVAGMILLTITVVGVLWYRFKKSRKRTPLPAAPLVKELYPSLAPTSHTITGSMTNDVDPPGYTEKNAFFGITSPLAHYFTSSPGASEKRQALV